MGWDSGIAYGSARANAHADGHTGEPGAVDTDCNMIAAKVVLAPLIGFGLAGSSLPRDTAAGLGVAAALILLLTPNCFAAIDYAPAQAEEQPEVVPFSSGQKSRVPPTPVVPELGGTAPVPVTEPGDPQRR